MTVKKPILICIVGPTAIGKTTLSIKLAKAFNTEILSADSRQFYKEMNIGTAVPSKEELHCVPHHFIQNKSIKDDFNVGDFEKEALNKLQKLFKKRAFVIMVGGSGLYVDAVTTGLNEFPEVPLSIRKQLNTEFLEKGLNFLQEELQKVDPAYYKKVDINNHHRLIRALEVYRSSGFPYSAYLNKEKTPRFFNTITIGLTASRELIYNRINQRVDCMLTQGLEDEAKKLLPFKNRNALQTVGYRELFQYFEGKLTKEQAVFEIKKNTRRFAKRQLTWFRKNKNILWFDYSEDSTEIIKAINDQLRFL